MIYRVSVKFGREELLQVTGNEITISISAAPERGRANAELVKKLARYFNVNTANIRIVAGHTSRSKIVEIS